MKPSLFLVLCSSVFLFELKTLNAAPLHPDHADILETEVLELKAYCLCIRKGEGFCDMPSVLERIPKLTETCGVFNMLALSAFSMQSALVRNKVGASDASHETLQGVAEAAEIAVDNLTDGGRASASKAAGTAAKETAFKSAETVVSRGTALVDEADLVAQGAAEVASVIETESWVSGILSPTADVIYALAWII